MKRRFKLEWKKEKALKTKIKNWKKKNRKNKKSE